MSKVIHLWIETHIFPVIAMGGVVLLMGCANHAPPRPPLLAPDVSMQAQQYVGTPLSGAIAGDPSTLKPDDAVLVRVTFASVEHLPPGFLEPLGSRLSLVVASGSGSPILPSAHLTQTIRFTEIAGAPQFGALLQNPALGRDLPIGSSTGICLPGTTATFKVEDQSARQVAVSVFRSPSPAAGAAPLSPKIGVTIADFVRPIAESRGEPGEVSTTQPTNAGARGTQPRLVYQRESVIFDQPSSAAFSLWIPIHLSAAPNEGVAVMVEIAPKLAASDSRSIVSRGIEELKRSSSEVASQPRVVSVDPPDWPGLSSALESLAREQRQRAGLAFLAQQTGDAVSEDVSLAADDTVLSRLAQQVRSAVAASPGEKNRASVGWAMEKTTWQLLLDLQSAGKMPSELLAVLSTHAGEAGRDPSTLQEVLNGVSGPRDLRNRLSAENYIFLQDSSPSARVRAFDWLNSRGLAPPGYDPLASTRDRRIALEKAEQTATNQSPAK